MLTAIYLYYSIIIIIIIIIYSTINIIRINKYLILF